MTLEFSLTKEEIIEYYFFTGWSSPDKKKFRIVYYLKAFGWPVIMSFIFWLIIKPQDFRQFLTFFSPFIIVGGMIAAYLGHSNYKIKIGKILTEKGNSTFFLKTELLLSYSGIISKDENTEVKYSWNAITKRAETKDFFYLYLNTVQAIIVPKRVFDSATEKAEFENYLSKYISVEADFVGK